MNCPNRALKVANVCVQRMQVNIELRTKNFPHSAATHLLDLASVIMELLVGSPVETSLLEDILD
jgi:hypothetical protein